MKQSILFLATVDSHIYYSLEKFAGLFMNIRGGKPVLERYIRNEIPEDSINHKKYYYKVALTFTAEFKLQRREEEL